MSVEQIRRCDIGQEPNAVHYRISVDGEHWDIDLCAEHAAPLMEIAKQGERSGSNATGVDPATRFRAFEQLIEE